MIFFLVNKIRGFSQKNGEDDLRSEINKALSLNDLFLIFNENENKIDKNCTVLFLRKFGNLIFSMNSENSKLLEQNFTIKSLLDYLEKNLTSFNEYHFVEIIVLIRKVRVHGLKYEGKIDKLLSETIKFFDEFPPSNAKIATQVFYEYSLLHLPTKSIFQLISGFLHKDNQQSYFTGYTISLLLKACAYNFGRFKRNYYADFCYQLLNLLEKNLKLFDLPYLCRLFKNICFLRLNLFTSQKKLHPCLVQLKTLIQEKRTFLQEKDFLCLLEGFIHAPVTFDNSLLLYLKSTALNTIHKNPANITLKFLIKFVDLMGQQFKEMRLKENSLEKVGDEILRRLQTSVNVKFSLIYDCFKAFADKNMYCHKGLFTYLYEKLIKTPEIEINQNLAIFILKMLIPVKFECQKLALIIKQKITRQSFNIPIDKLLDVLYIYSHPFFQASSESDFSSFCQEIILSLKKGINSNKLEIVNSFLFILAREYAHVINPLFLQLQTLALQKIGENWENLRGNRKFDLILSFINSKSNKEEWCLFLIGKTSNLNLEDLESLLNQYIFKETKEFDSFDLVLNSLISTSMENRQKMLKKILDVFIETPPYKIVNLKGNPNQNIFKLINLINFDVDIRNYEISYSDILKFARFFTILDIDTDFIWPLLINSWKNKSLFKDLNAKNLLFLEIGAFLVESASFSKKFQNIRKKMKVAGLLNKENEKKVQIFENGSDSEIKLISQFQDIFDISSEIYNVLTPVFQTDFASRKKNLSLSWITKFGKIFNFLKEYSSNLNDISSQIFDEIKIKINERVVDNKTTILKAIFCLIELDVSGAKFDLYHKDFINTQLEV